MSVLLSIMSIIGEIVIAIVILLLLKVVIHMDHEVDAIKGRYMALENKIEASEDGNDSE